MQNPRLHGQAPYIAAALHGGPGAQGACFAVAHELGRAFGVLEPLQTQATVAGQAEELRQAILLHSGSPVTLIGHSWGAWLGWIFAARHPELVKKLILVCSGPFLESWTADMLETRLSRLSAAEAAEARGIMAGLGSVQGPEKDTQFARMGILMAKADAFDPLPEESGCEVVCDEAVYRGVWSEAAEMRRSGELLAMAGDIACPVLAIHGDWDPHPWRGVKEPLEKAIKDFRFVLLERCGHEPWRERQARDRFFEILREELETEDVDSGQWL